MDMSNSAIAIMVLLFGLLVLLLLAFFYFFRSLTRSSILNKKPYQYDFDHENLTLYQEGSNVRVSGDNINYVFGNTDVNNILKIYGSVIVQVRDLLGPRWIAYQGENISAEAFRYLTQKQAFWEILCYFNARTPLKISASHRNSGEMWRTIQNVVELRFQRGAAEATSLCAALMGIPPDEYLKWQKNNEQWLNK